MSGDARRTPLSKENATTRKLKLHAEPLTVTSFKMEIEAAAMRGTVEAHEVNSNNTEPFCCQLAIRTCASWEFSCRAEAQA